MKREGEESEQLHGERRCLNYIAAAAMEEDSRALPKSLQTSREFSGGEAFRAAHPRPTLRFVQQSLWDARESCQPLRVALAMDISKTSFAICIA
jgi:hypothetical protein